MRRFSFLSLLLLFSAILNAQLVINEFMAGNTKTLMDENSEYEDWIEIYNPGDISVNLSGYYITDNFSDPLKFKLSPTTIIAAKGFLVIFADDDESQGAQHASFKLSMDGEEIAIFKLSGTDTILVDSLTFTAQSNDISFGRYPDGNNYLEIFSSPTPGAVNTSSNLSGIAPLPVFSIPGGFYTGAQTVEITSGIAGAKIRYTTNGSEPDTNSLLYTSAITSDTTFILKAKVYANNYVPGNKQTATYFINEHFTSFSVSERVPVLSVSCNPEYLFNQSQGILINYENDIEVPASVELYEPDGTNKINQGAGLKVYGNASRRMEQKSLVAFARSKYGKGSFDYKFFDDKPFDKYESFVMRNGGSDWSLTYFRDALCQALVRNDMELEAQGSKHAILYLNGKFYGIIDLKEKVNEHFVEQNYGVDGNNIDMVNHTMEDEELIYGDLSAYIEFKYFLLSNDMSNPTLFNYIDRKMDLKNYMDIQIAQIYIANLDMFLNSKYWRVSEKYGKWRWIMYDTELSFGQGDYSYTNEYGTQPFVNTLDFATVDCGRSNWPYLRPWSSEKIIALLNNETYKNEFIQTFAAHINTTFKPYRVLHMIDSMQQRISKEIPYQISTYGGHNVDFNPYGNHFTTVGEWEHYVDTMRYFAINRPDYMRSFIIDRFELDTTFQLKLSSDYSDACSFSVMGVKVPADSVGFYFKNVPLTIKAEPHEGYRFVKWQGTKSADSLSKEINLLLNSDATIKAIFEPEGDVMISEVFYKPTIADSMEFIEIHNPKHSTTVDLSGYSISGAVEFTFPAATSLAPGEYLMIAPKDSAYKLQKVQVFEWTSGTLNDGSGIIVLKDNINKTIDSVSYTGNSPWPVISDNSSIELIKNDLDNNEGVNWKKGISLGGSAGMPAFTDAVKSIKINEFSADNVGVLADEYNECDDWIELLNTGTEPVDLGGLYMTNKLSEPNMFRIPVNNSQQTIIEPGEYKIIWADDDSIQGPLHLGFKLSASGGAIGLSADGKTNFESVQYGSQNEDISYGRYTDGSINWRNFSYPTPGNKNSLPPVITSEPALWCLVNETYKYNLTATDEDGDELFIALALKPSWLNYVETGNGTASISGIMPNSATKQFQVGLFVTDGYSDPIIQTFIISKGAPTSIVDQSLAMGNFICYPNPTNGRVTVEASSNSQTALINVCNVSGQIVLSKHIKCAEGVINDEIDITDQKKGIYYITIIAEEGTSTQKIVLY